MLDQLVQEDKQNELQGEEMEADMEDMDGEAGEQI